MEGKYEHILKALFQTNGFLARQLKNQPIELIDRFLNQEKVQLTARNFEIEVVSQFYEVLNYLVETTRKEERIAMANKEELAISDESLTSELEPPSNINTDEVGVISESNLSCLDEVAPPVSNQPSIKPPVMPIDQQATLTASSVALISPEEPPVSPDTATVSLVSPSIVSVPLDLSLTLKPGEIPPANTPAPKPQVQNLEQSRTTFSITANGKANVEFVGKVEGKSANGTPVKIIDVVIPPVLDLSFNAATSEITGIPLQSGEFTLKVHFQFEKHESGNPTPVGECNLIINPDPKTLWKHVQSDKDDEYWKSDEDIATISGKDGLDIIVASKRGRSHAHVGSFRDDDFCLMQDDDSGWRVITVADGAGSAKMSRKGSFIASRTATESVLKAVISGRGQKLEEAICMRESDPISAQKLIHDELYYLFGNAATEAVQAIDNEAKAKGAAYKDFSTTLIVTIHKKVSAGHFVAAYWVGDGGVGIYQQGQEVKVLGKADSGEFAGQTRFLDFAMLAPQEISKRIDAKIVPDFTSIIAMTDGITDPWFETDVNIENIEKWDELWSELSPALNANVPASGLLDWLDFWSPGNHDDRTIAVLYSTTPVTQVSTESVV